MRVLIIKTTSMGDIIHTLPALSDAAKVYPNITFDWVVEDAFQSMPGWHPCVKKIIPISLRRWRRNQEGLLKGALVKGEIFKFIRNLRQTRYDKIIDAQGLLKSAWISWVARGKTAGYSFASAREPLASLFYQQKVKVSWKDHAVKRARRLFAESLAYPIPNTPPDYGISLERLPAYTASNQVPYFVFLHGTTWATKHWPENYWVQLGQILSERGFHIKLLWGNSLEEQRARRIELQVKTAEVLPKLTLEQAASVLAHASGIVSVDTGLGHLAAALNIPTVSLYGPSDPVLTGTDGLNQIHLKTDFSCSPCFSKSCMYSGKKPEFNIETKEEVDPPCYASLTPQKVYQSLMTLMDKA